MMNMMEISPGTQIYTGGVLGNLSDPSGANGAAQVDFFFGENSYDRRTRCIHWYHWNGQEWEKRLIADDCPVHVGMALADLTGNGKADLIVGEWVFDGWRNDETGSIFWFEQPDDVWNGKWERHTLMTDWKDPHDVLVGHIGTGTGPDVLIRDKNGRICWYAKPENPRDLWLPTVVADRQDGDGTALYDVTGTGRDDIVTGTGFYENVAGNGKEWVSHPFKPLQGLNMDHETRVAVGDLTGDGSVTVVISESELLENARIVLLHSADRGRTWTLQILTDQDRGLGSIHSLQLVANGNGRWDIFAAEMEVWQEHTGVVRSPKWLLYRNQGGLQFEETVLLDGNLGAHMGCAGYMTRPDRPDFIAKNWHANSNNALHGRNHVIHLAP